MLKGKYLAGMLTAYLLLFALPFFFEIPLSQQIIVATVLFLLLCLSIFVGNRHHLKGKRTWLLLGLALLLLGSSVLYGIGFRTKNLTPAAQYCDDRSHNISAVITDIRYDKPYGAAYEVSIFEIDGEDISFGAVLELPAGEGLLLGDKICVTGDVAAVSGTYEMYHKSRGILLEITAENAVYLGGETPSETVFDHIRAYIEANFKEYIGGIDADYAIALLTGDRDSLDGQLSLAYQRLGISHVLAVSGMHFSVIVGALDILLRALTLSKRKKNVALILFAVFFAGICGFSASILRALIMFCLYYAAELLGERSDSLTSLLVASALIVTANPWSVFDAGFWLSALSTLGIVLVSPLMQKMLCGRPKSFFLRLGKRPLKAILCMTLMNLTALFFTMPVTYLLFGGISLISPLANLIFIPLTEFILILLVVLTFVSFLPLIASPLGAFCGWLIGFADTWARTLSDIPDIFLSIRYPFAATILVFLILGVLAVLFLGEFHPKKLFVVFLATFLAFSVSLSIYTKLSEDQTGLMLTTDGNNDVLTVMDSGEVVLIDFTSGAKGTPMRAVEALSEDFFCEIDVYVLTHLHARHAETLPKLCDLLKIHKILLPYGETDADREHILAIAEALAGVTEIEFYRRDGNAVLEIGETVLHLPDYETLSRSEHPTLTIFATIKGQDAWCYLGASSLEDATLWQEITSYRALILGCHGPKVKNLYHESCLGGAELLLFSSVETMEITDTEKLSAEVRFVSESYRIAFAYEE